MTNIKLLDKFREYVGRCNFCGVVRKARYYVNEEFVAKVGQRIKALRKEHNHTQEYLIEKVRLSINSYEAGSKIPTLMSIYKICEFYDISLAEFFMSMDYPPKTGKTVERMPVKNK